MSEEPFENGGTEYEKNADGEQKDPCEGMFKSVRDAFKSGAEDAKKKAEESAPDVKSAVGKAAYGLAFGLAYGSSYGLTMVKELIPGVMKEGGAEGFSAGREAAERTMRSKEEDGDKPVVVEAEYSVS